MSETNMKETILCLAEKLAIAEAEKAALEKERDMYRNLWRSVPERGYGHDSDGESGQDPVI